MHIQNVHADSHSLARRSCLKEENPTFQLPATGVFCLSVLFIFIVIYLFFIVFSQNWPKIHILRDELENKF